MTITIPTRQLCIQGATFQTPHMCCLTSRIESITLETELERGSLSDFENTGKGIVIPKEIIFIISKTMFFSIHNSKRDECRTGMGRETYMWLTLLLISFWIKWSFVSAAYFRHHRKELCFVVRFKKGRLKPTLSGKPRKLVLEICLPPVLGLPQDTTMLGEFSEKFVGSLFILIN